MTLKYCQIRPDKGDGAKARVKTPWSIEVGIFKDYLREESKSLDGSCFEADWDFMKMPRIKYSDEEDVKAEMRKVYPILREAYKVQAGYEPTGTVFCIGSNRMSAFMGEEWLGCLDEEG